MIRNKIVWNPMIKTRTIFILIVFLLFGVLNSCTTLPFSIKKVGVADKVALRENEKLVFGKFVLVENGKIITRYRNLSFTIFPVASKKVGVGMDIQEKGEFYWVISEGTYVISDLRNCSQDYSMDPGISFHVPLVGGAFYLGTLRLEVEVRGTGLFSTFVGHLKSIEVVDDFDEAREAIMSRNPDLAGRIIEKNLMSKIPNSSPTITEFPCGGFFFGFPVIKF